MARFYYALQQAIFSAIIAFIIFGPITGIILNDYDYVVTLDKPLFLAATVFLVRFLFIWYLTATHKFTWLQKLLSPQDLHVVVAKPNPNMRSILILYLILALCFPWFLTNYWLTILILAMIYVLLGLGLNIVVGLAGLLDLGYVAFYAVGAYTYALGHLYFGLSFWLALPLGALFAACFGVILGFPVLRMHGDYLAIVTLGFGEIIRLVLNNWAAFTGGPNGVAVAKPTLFGLAFTRYANDGVNTFHGYFGLDYTRTHFYLFIYFILLGFVLFVIYAANRLQRMPIGRAWEALREDEIACRSLGINHVTTKLSAFCLGALIGGLGGVFFAAYQGFVNPTSFTFIESALILAIVVLGGMGSILGVVVAALIITILPEVLRDFSEYRILVFGLVMVVMMIWRPRGLIRVKRYPYECT